MIKYGYSPEIILSLINYYKESYMMVNRNGDFSKAFQSLIGVKQGGRASPSLFSIYLEEVLSEITAQKAGVKLSQIKIDVIAYADDIVVFSNTKKGLQELLNTIADFGRKYEIKFNPDKTLYMIFNNHIKRTVKECNEDRWQGELELDGKAIQKVKVFKYLGFDINDENNDHDHIENRKKAAQKALSKLKNLDILTERTNPFLKGHLYKTYVMPVLTYGFEVLQLKKTVINDIERYENNLIRNIYGIPKRCKMTNLKLINNLSITNNRIKRTQVDFFVRLLENDYTKKIIKELLSYSSNGNYVNGILDLLNNENLDIVQKCKAYNYFLDEEHKTNRKNNIVYDNLRKIFTENNGNSQHIYNLLRFDNEIYK
ncbi:unnamed protein product [Brachionus calyciflorus]|uniref:Reverse transcriptase domain-containing protein n=1 Tax=Brachionus calyciflorus TaxID=104777 RepID=A0A813RC07_9BILA|nr:unnamed protein product [Brachionus calyciflorus]